MWTLFLLAACGHAARDTSSGGPSGNETGTPDDSGCEVDWFYDGDADGFGLAEASVTACTQPVGYAAESGDCDDTTLSVNPSAAETCNDVDDDCNGVPDDNPTDPTTWVRDTDGDGAGAEASGIVAACDAPEGYSSAADPQDCDDDNGGVHPGAEEDCAALDRDCDGDPTAGATDLQTVYADIDGDGFGDPATPSAACDEGEGLVLNDNDCDDLDPDVHPGAEERCNDLDDDCDDNVDFGAIDRSTYYLDADADGYGAGSTSVLSCSTPSGYSERDDDCDDADATTHPDAAEACGGGDENCDGTIDEPTAVDAPVWYSDADGDGYGDAATASSACTAPAGGVADSTDCDDADDAVHPTADEVCGGADEDCDGATDESDAIDAVDHYDDADGDGYGAAATFAHGCLPAGRVTDATDCDDSAATTNPGELEVCGDTVDDDCDGSAPGCFTGAHAAFTAALGVSGGSPGNGFGRSAAGGDLSGDGQDDLVVLGSNDTLYYFEGPVSAGGATLADLSWSSVGANTSWLTEGIWADRDVTGDGVDDLVLFPCQSSYSGGYGASACVAPGPVSGSSNFYPRFSANSGHSMEDASLGDIDGDGTPELLGILDSSVVYAYEPGDPTWTASTVWLGTAGYTGRITAPAAGVTSADFTGDGVDEVVVGAANILRIFDAVTSSTVAADAAASLTTTGSTDTSRAVGDVDGDGLADLTWSLPATGVGSAYLVTDPMAGGAIESTLAVASFTSSGSVSAFPVSIQSADLDGDGADELLFGTYDNTDGAGYIVDSGPSGALVVEADAEAWILNPVAANSAPENNVLLPVGDPLGFGRPTVLYGTPQYSSNIGYAFLFSL